MMRSKLYPLAAAITAFALGLTVSIAAAGDTNPGHYEADADDTWGSVAAAKGLTGSGSGTDSIVDTAGDKLQQANRGVIAPSGSDNVLIGNRTIIHIPEVAPPTTTTLPPGPTTTTTVFATTTTAPATTTTQPVTTTTAPATTTTAPPATTTTQPPATTTTVPAPTTTQPAGVQFSEDFSLQSSVDRFTWQTSHGGVDPFPRDDQPRSWHADHDMACGAPPTLRTVNLAPASQPGPISVTGGGAFWCAPNSEAAKGHVMTSTVLTAYGHIDFSPSRSFTNVNRICWDMNRSELGGRKWAQVSIIPEAAFQANGGVLDYVRPNLEGDVAAAGPDLPPGAFLLTTFRSEALMSVGDGVETGADPTEGFTQGGSFGKPASDRAARYPHCLERTATGTRFTSTDTSQDPDDPWPVHVGLDMPTGPVRVIFQDVTYDSIKGDWEQGGAPDNTNTWHWDNITIS
jgi:hypothetical protein